MVGFALMYVLLIESFTRPDRLRQFYSYEDAVLSADDKVLDETCTCSVYRQDAYYYSRNSTPLYEVSTRMQRKAA